MEFTELEYRLAKAAAESVRRNNHGYLDGGDVLGAVYEWMAKHYSQVVHLRSDDEDQDAKPLRQELYRAAQRFAYEERLRRTGSQPGDLHFYTSGQVEELLPAVWDYADWHMSSSSGDPAEGNHRLAMLIDVSSAVFSLRPHDTALLHMRYREGLTLERIGHELGVTDDAVRLRMQRIVGKVVRALGGEPPWWRANRKVTTNASAAAQLRNP